MRNGLFYTDILEIQEMGALIFSCGRSVTIFLYYNFVTTKLHYCSKTRDLYEKNVTS